ncbi:MAG: hypothetical protein AAFO79_04350, partial [Pseudomonadota bacterium]
RPSGARTTYVLAGLAEATPYRAVPSAFSAGLQFVRVASSAGNAPIPWNVFAAQPVLTDDFAPVDRLIGVN